MNPATRVTASFVGSYDVEREADAAAPEAVRA
jgi:hypothetical protein